MNNKLVRDKIPDIMRGLNTTPIIYTASKSEYWFMLKNKLQEEVNEFLKDNNVEELADIQEVLYAIYEFKELSKEEVESIRLRKVKDKGSFKKRIILQDIEYLNNEEE